MGFNGGNAKGPGYGSQINRIDGSEVFEVSCDDNDVSEYLVCAELIPDEGMLLRGP